MRDQNLLQYILNHPRINFIDHNFIKTALHTCCLHEEFKMHINKLINHPVCSPLNIFDEDTYHILNTVLYKNRIMIEIVKSNNIIFIEFLLEYIYNVYHNNYNYYRFLQIIIANVDDIGFVTNKMLDIITNNNCNQHTVELIMKCICDKKSNAMKIFDKSYINNDLLQCKEYISSGMVNIKDLFDAYKHGKYKMLSKIFMYYY